MVALKDKVQDALDEARTLVLGTQVLLGFQCQSAFEPGFMKLSAGQQGLSLFSLVLLIENFMLLLLPAAHHIIGDRGNDTAFEYRLTSRCIAIALPLFALSIGIDIFLSLTPIIGQASGAGVGALLALVALGSWFGLRPARSASTTGGETKEVPLTEKSTPLQDKIRHVLTETRVVLPGAQALLGFAFVTTMLDAFQSMDTLPKIVHLASLIGVAVSIILLMTPAAIHRLAEHGEATERFHRLASRLVIAALVPLGLSLAGELFVVVEKVTASPPVATALALLATASFALGWFVLPIAMRQVRRT